MNKNDRLYGPKQKNQGKYFVREGMNVDKEKLPNGKNIPNIPYEQTLFLTHAASFDKGICATIWHFVRKIYLIGSDTSSYHYLHYNHPTIKLLENKSTKQELINFLSVFHLNYSDMSVRTDPEEPSEAF